MSSILFDKAKQDVLYARILESKCAVEKEPWSEIVNSKKEQKIFEVEKV